MSPLHIYADSASQGHVGSLDPLSLCCIYAHLLFNPVNVKILPSSLWLYHLPEIPVKSLDNLSVHFCLKETHNLRAFTDSALNQVKPFISGSDRAAGFHSLPFFSEWLTSLTEIRVWVGKGAAQGYIPYICTVLTCNSVIFLNKCFWVYCMPLIYFQSREMVVLTLLSRFIDAF